MDLHIIAELKNKPNHGLETTYDFKENVMYRIVIIYENSSVLTI